jgi:hypothetical protein
VKSIAKSALGGVVATLLASAAYAADVPPVVLPVVQPVVIAPAPAGFSFAGVYAGVAAGAFFSTPGFVYENTDLQAQAGFNLVHGRLLVGVEGRALAIVASGEPFVLELGADVRVGLVLGDRVLVYGRGGGAIFLPGGGFDYTLGGGVEVGVGQRLSMFGEAVAYGAPGVGFLGVDLRAGINLHLGH